MNSIFIWNNISNYKNKMLSESRDNIKIDVLRYKFIPKEVYLWMKEY